MKEWNWSHNIEYEIHAKLEDNTQSIVTYRIFKYSQLVSEDVNYCPWAISRTPVSDDIADGYLGVWNDKTGIICGYGMACAMGLPASALFIDYKECQKICKRDFENLKEGNDIILIEDPKFREACLRKATQ